MKRRRSPLRAGAAVFVLLSVAMHAGVWTAARRGTSPADDRLPQASVRLVALVAPEPEAVAAAAPAPSAPEPTQASARAVPSKPRAQKAPPKATRTRPTSRTPRAAQAASAAQPAPSPSPNPAAWSRPVALPEFDDSIDPTALLAASSRDSPGESAVAAIAPQPPRAAAASAPPQPQPLAVVAGRGSVRYRVHYGDPVDGNVVATLQQRYEIDSDRYRLHSEGRASGLVSWFYRGTLLQESSGRVSALGLQPERYRERRGERGEKETLFDVDAARVHFASGAEASLPPGAQDRLSVFVQLGLLLHAEPARFAPGAVLEIPVLASARVEATTFRVLGNETVTAGEAAIAALHLRREPLDDEDPAIDLWLALEPQVLPLRVRVTEASGRALDQIVVVDDDR